MAELIVYTSASDGHMVRQSTEGFQFVHDSATGNRVTGSSGIHVGLRRDSLTWYLNRAFLFFDTSALLPGALISAAVLSIKIYSPNTTGGHFDIVIQNGQPTYPHDPLDFYDFLYSYYSGDGGSINSSTIAHNVWSDITLNSTGRGWINKGGVTKLCLRTSNDINEDDISVSTGSDTYFYAYEKGAEDKPKLVITYTYPPPTVTTQAVTDRDETTATGNGNIIVEGVDAPSKRGIVYHTSSHGDPGNTSPADSDYANYEEELGSFGTGAFSRPLSGLARGDRYYVRAYAYNSGGYSYGSEVNFYTYPTVTTQIPTGIQRADPTTLTANGLIELDVVEDITTRGFKYGLTETDTWDKSEPDNGGGPYTEGTFSLTIDANLVADTTYYIRAYAIGAWGTKYGSYLEFKTAYPYGANKVEIKSEATASASDISAVGGKRTLTIENHLIQNQTIADIISAAYLVDYKDQKTKLVITKPCPAPYEIGDTVERGAGIPYAPAVSAVISYAPAATAVHPYGLAPHDMLIRKISISFSAGNYVSILELES